MGSLDLLLTSTLTNAEWFTEPSGAVLRIGTRPMTVVLRHLLEMRNLQYLMPFYALGWALLVLNFSLWLLLEDTAGTARSEYGLSPELDMVVVKQWSFTVTGKPDFRVETLSPLGRGMHIPQFSYCTPRGGGC